MADENVVAAPDTAQDTAQDILSGIQNSAAGAAPPQAIPTQDDSTLAMQPTRGTVPSNNPQTLWDRTMFDVTHALSRAADFLSPGEVARVTQDPDGNYTVTKSPATTGEKWGRIAAAALGGAATGLANAQGPGGMAKATAAGTQFGMQMPQQQQQQAQQEASYQQQQLIAKANRIHLTQQGYLLAQQVAAAKLANDKTTAETLQAYEDLLTNSPGNKDFGIVDPSDPESVPRAAAGNPAFMDAFLGKGNQNLRYVSGPDHKIHAIGVDKTIEQQRNTEPGIRFEFTVDQDNNPSLEKKTVPVGGATNGDLYTHNQAELNKYFAAKLNKAKADKAEAGPAAKQLDTPDKTLDAWRTETDPTKKAGLWSQYQRQRADALALRGKDAEGAAVTPPGFNVAAAQIRDNGGTIDQALAAVPLADRNSVRAIGEGRMAPPSRYTKEGERMMGLVNSVYPDYDATQFKTYQAARERFTSGAEGTGMAFIQTARNHLARMENNIPDNVSIPWGVGSLYNTVKNAANRSTDPKLKAFEDDLNAVSSEVARAYSGKALTDPEHDKMISLLNESDSPEALRGAINEFRELLNGKLDSYRTQWNASMPRGVVSPNRMLESLEAGQQTTPPRPPPPPPPANTGNPPAPPNTPNSATAFKAPPPGANFDASLWHRLNPNLDLNRAMQQAKQKGLPVVNVPQGFNAP